MNIGRNVIASLLLCCALIEACGAHASKTSETSPDQTTTSTAKDDQSKGSQSPESKKKDSNDQSHSGTHDDSKNPVIPGSGANPPVIAPVEVPTLKWADVESIITTQCSVCHRNATRSKPLITTYESANAIANDILTDVQNGDMPPDPTKMSEDDKTTIIKWVQDGALK
jgi:hypothetical protein